MICPTCNAKLDQEDQCPACGADVTPLKAALELRRDIESLRQQAATLNQAASSLLGRYQRLEYGLRDAISKVPATKPPPEPAPEPEPHADLVTEPANTEPAKTEPAPAAPAKPTPPKAPPPLPKAVRDPISELKLGQKGLLIVGIVVMVLGIGYFLKYSFEQGWVQPPVRVLLSYLAGLGLLALGEGFRRKQMAVFGLNIIGGGIATLYFASFAGFHLYDLIPQLAAFALMALVTALACGLALAYDTKWLAVLGLIGGFVTPVVLSTGSNQLVALMSYLTLLNLGILALAFRKRWSLLTYLGCAATWLLFTAWMARHYTEAQFWPAYGFQLIFFLIYALAPFAYFFVQQQETKLRGFAISFPNAFIAFGFSYLMIEGVYEIRYVSLATLGYTLIFLYMATWLLRHRPAARPAFVLMAAKAMLFLGITVPVFFDGPWTTIFWAVQAIALLWAATKLDNRWLYAGASALFVLTLTKLFMYDYLHSFDLGPRFTFRPGYTATMIERWLTELTLVAAAAWFGHCLWHRGKQLCDRPRRDSIIFIVLGVLALFTILNIELYAAAMDYLPAARHATISVLWTLVSIALIAIGFRQRLRPVRRVALTLFGATLLKIFLVDMGDASQPFRIVSFIVLGLVLIGASFLYHKYKDLVLPPEEESP